MNDRTRNKDLDFVFGFIAQIRKDTAKNVIVTELFKWRVYVILLSVCVLCILKNVHNMLARGKNVFIVHVCVHVPTRTRVCVCVQGNYKFSNPPL